MFQRLDELVTNLKNCDIVKIENGVYVKCKEARAILQEIKLEAQGLRVSVINCYHENKKVKAKKTKDESKVESV